MTRHDAENALRAIFATLAFVLLSLGSTQAWMIAGTAIWIATYAWTSYRVLVKRGELFRDIRLGTYVVVRIILVAALIAVIARDSSQFSWIMVVAVSGYVALVSIEGLIRRAYSYRGTQVVDLPGITLKGPSVSFHKGYVISALAAPIAFACFVLMGVGGTIVSVTSLLLLAIVGGFGLMILLEARKRRNLSRIAYETLPEVLNEFEPKFVFYWDAPRGTAYQVGMWVPYLKRIGERFFIMVRNPSTFNQAASVADGVPVLLARTMADMDRLVPESITTAFYSNNGARNAHFVRYSHLTHVQLLHGDSDKASSFNPVTAMFDKVYVAGQAGIDRYVNHDVHIPAEKFRIVGRPQVEDILRAREPIREKNNPVVLYAPTWRGAYSDASYSSMPVAPELFDRLLERDCRIIFRPHPYCIKDPEYREIIQVLHSKLTAHNERTGILHIYGEEAEVTMDVVDCFNACDAMISDVSSVVVDFLYSEKPFALVSMGLTAEQFMEEFPLAKASYVLTEDQRDWGETLVDLLMKDSLAEKRRSMRVHYLGDFAPERYAEGFISEARAQVLKREKNASALGDVNLA